MPVDCPQATPARPCGKEASVEGGGGESYVAGEGGGGRGEGRFCSRSFNIFVISIKLEYIYIFFTDGVASSSFLE